MDLETKAVFGTSLQQLYVTLGCLLLGQVWAAIKTGSKIPSLHLSESSLGLIIPFWPSGAGFPNLSTRYQQQLPPASSCDNQKCLQIVPHVPWKANSPLVGNHGGNEVLRSSQNRGDSCKGRMVSSITGCTGSLR